MDDRKFHLHDGKKGSALAIRITPRASQNKIVDVLGDGTVKIHLAAKPTEEEMNTILVKFLADQLKISPTRLEIVAGDTGRDKLISVLDMDADALHKMILALLAKD